jgi:antitoxin component HigA of HigAB toxin-antitoxin module
MKKITSEKAYRNALEDVQVLIKKGEKKITTKEAVLLTEMADAKQAYEKIYYPFPHYNEKV